MKLPTFCKHPDYAMPIPEGFDPEEYAYAYLGYPYNSLQLTPDLLDVLEQSNHPYNKREV